MSTRLTAAQDGSATLYGLTAGHEYDVEAKDVTPPPPPPSGIVVPKVPAGVPGNWVNIFADAFAVPLGTGLDQDNLWYPNRGGTKPTEWRTGDNASELQAYSSSQVHQDTDGLHLRCEPVSGAGLGGFLSGTVRTVNSANPAGYKLFKYTPTKGQAFVVECRWRLPQTTGEEDPGFWSVSPGWYCEIDHSESWGYGERDYQNEYRHGCPIWLYNTADVSKYKVGHWVQLGDDAAMNKIAGVWHTFTTSINADFTMDFYLDGVHKWKVPAPSSPVNRLPMGLVLSHALRGGHKYGPWPSPRNVDVRYVAVYTDAAHAGQNYWNGGVAPGTVLA